MLSWFAVQVRTRGEAQVEAFLRHRNYDTFSPTYTECRRYSDRIRKVQSSVFPGYLFCRFDAERRAPVLATPGVHQVVSFGRGPVPVDPAEIESLRRVLESGADLRPWPWLASGDRVRVEYGAFAGLEGVLVSAKGEDRLVLSVTLLQRSAAVEIDRSWVRPVDESRGFRRAVA